MENVISKKRTGRTDGSSKKITPWWRQLRPITLEEASNCPFTMKKHNKAVATLSRYPVPEELLEQLRNGSNH